MRFPCALLLSLCLLAFLCLAAPTPRTQTAAKPNPPSLRSGVGSPARIERLRRLPHLGKRVRTLEDEDDEDYDDDDEAPAPKLTKTSVQDVLLVAEGTLQEMMKGVTEAVESLALLETVLKSAETAEKARAERAVSDAKAYAARADKRHIDRVVRLAGDVKKNFDETEKRLKRGKSRAEEAKQKADDATARINAVKESLKTDKDDYSKDYFEAVEGRRRVYLIEPSLKASLGLLKDAKRFAQTMTEHALSAEIGVQQVIAAASSASATVSLNAIRSAAAKTQTAREESAAIVNELKERVKSGPNELREKVKPMLSDAQAALAVIEGREKEITTTQNAAQTAVETIRKSISALEKASSLHAAQAEVRSVDLAARTTSDELQKANKAFAAVGGAAESVLKSKRDADALGKDSAHAEEVQKNDSSADLTGTAKKEEGRVDAKTPQDSQKRTTDKTETERKKESATEDKKQIPMEDKKQSPTEDKKQSATEDKKQIPTEDKKQSPTEDKKEIPTEGKKQIPAEDKKEIPTEDKKESPTEDKKEIPTEDKKESPTEDKKQIPTEDKKEIPTEDKKEIPTEDKKEIPTEDKKESPTEDKKQIPTEDKKEIQTKDKKQSKKKESIQEDSALFGFMSPLIMVVSAISFFV